MSYDLFLASPRLTAEAFAAHFAGRPHYAEAPGVYGNPDTGVYFQFSYSPEPLQEGAAGGHVAFNLNYYRPHVFGLEAEPEVSALVEAFGCTILDPQMDGMGEGAYSAEGFLRGWNRGNLFGYQAIGAKADPGAVFLADAGRIEAAWRWNLGRRARQARWGENAHFAPLTYWGRRAGDGAAVTFSIWSDTVRTAFPACSSHALIIRKRSVSKGLFRGREEVTESRLLSLEEIAALPGCEWREVDGERLLLAPVAAPPSPAVLAVFEQGFQRGVLIDRVTTDHVLDAALMTQARATATSTGG